MSEILRDDKHVISGELRHLLSGRRLYVWMQDQTIQTDVVRCCFSHATTERNPVRNELWSCAGLNCDCMEVCLMWRI